MEIVASINNVKAWMGELLREGCNPNDYLNITENSSDGDSSGGSKSTFRFTIYTRLNEYHIVAVQETINNKFKSYLGCTCTSRIREPGEDWNRGRDLKDGKLSRYTWEKIKDDILWHELVQISPYILRREGKDVTEEKKVECSSCYELEEEEKPCS
jgi:hypothetical protein